MSQIGNIYTEHHANNRPRGFTIMEEGRSKFLTENIGTGKKILDKGCYNGELPKRVQKHIIFNLIGETGK